jgi:hypothetical protein
MKFRWQEVNLPLKSFSDLELEEVLERIEDLPPIGEEVYIDLSNNGDLLRINRIGGDQWCVENKGYSPAEGELQCFLGRDELFKLITIFSEGGDFQKRMEVIEREECP